MQTFTGIDIGSRYVKVVELEFKPAPKLISNILFRTPFLMRDSPGQDMLDAKAFWQKLAEYIPLERIKASRVAVNIPSSSVMAVSLLLPRMSRHELNAVAQTEARRRMIPASGPTHVFESSIIGERVVNKAPRVDVLAVRTDKLFIDQVLDLFKEVEVIPKSITLSSCAYFTMFPPEALSKKDVDTAFVDIGMTSINTSIFKEGKLNFFRNTAFGLRDIIQDMGSHLSLTDSEAEDVIRDKGVPDVSVDFKDKVAVAEEIMKQKYEASLRAAQENQKEEINLLELRVLWQTHIERIIHELRRSLAYYKEQAEGRRVEYIYFLGGGCQIQNLISFITAQIGGQWQIILPFKNIQLPKEKEALDQFSSTPIFANAASLALSLGVKTKRAEVISFLPFEFKKKEIIATRRFVLRLTKVALIFVLVLLSGSTFMSNRLLRLSVKTVTAELKGVKKVANKLKDLTQQENRRQQEALQVEETGKGKKNFYLFLKKINSAVPEEVLINSVSVLKAGSAQAAAEPQEGEGQPAAQPVQQYKIEIKAQVFADYEKANKKAQEFRRNLEKAAVFNNLNFTPIKLEKIISAVSGNNAQEIQLTQPKTREFTVTSEIAAGTI